MRPDLTEKYERFRQLLVDARKSAGLKQTDLADRLGRPQSYVSKIERGERGVDVIEFLEIAKAIGFKPAAFLHDLD
jgi:transcriptional regulator with XRE-family HTH domain